MNITYLLFGVIIGLFFQKNIMPILESLFELILLKLEHIKSAFVYDINLTNKETNELNIKEKNSGKVGFRIKGDNNA